MHRSVDVLAGWTRCCSQLQEMDGFVDFFRDFSDNDIRLLLRLGGHIFELFINKRMYQRRG